MSPDDEPTAEEVLIHSESSQQTPPELRILHFNDVYHVEAGSQEPVGGIARFQTLCKYYAQDQRFTGQPGLITLFSGDAFNPSLESSVTKGAHMVPVLNNIGTACACVGNHDLDFGVSQFAHLAEQCTFPWLLANVLDPGLGDDVSLGNAEKTVMLTSSNGIKIGVIGLVERDWLDTINSLPPNIIYKSASATAKALIPGLREQGAEIIIAVTHQREPNDNKLAEETPPGMIDLILGGHDHFYNHSLVNGTHVLRSGSDFKQLSYIEGRRKPNGSARWDFDIIRRDIVKEIPEDEETLKLVDKLTSSLNAKLEQPIGYTAAPLDARFMTVRLRESNIGNFVCDLIRYYYQADCCIMAAGTIRGDQIYPPGVLKLKDIMNCFPFEDPVVVVRLKGKVILEALENAVGKYPALEGRFPQVSNIEIEFDPSRPESSRILTSSIDSKPLDLEKDYTLATRDYMVRGKDGFTSLLLTANGGTADSLVSEENGLLISTILRQYFISLRVLGRWKRWSAELGRHWGGVQSELHGIHPVREPPPPVPQSGATIGRGEEQERAEVGGDGVSVPGLVGRAQHDVVPPSESENDNDKRSNLPAAPANSDGLGARERELLLARKVSRKWWRLAGLKGRPGLCDEVGEEGGVDWTRGIAPRVEGRIRIVG
ncbi:hypothetical protein LTR66_014953 [Elasticomyces elasticus]|nr:hypothetical protein LTR66_014953 [Elasticomyces elasticus]